ncbi:MAG: hypothetical protein LBG15_12585 [Dysgonamonadaceae bacterium]|jgi:hypothetical protein|nr:hypothetical protein [Dysgonamonadaceae bacterium]
MVAFAQIEITDPEKLFGRKELITKLVVLANRHDNVAIIGTRRFGKTCLLKCMETKLRQDENSKSYPIYFDFKEVGSIIKGTDEVYKYMISIIVSRLCNDKHFTEEETIRKITIKPESDWEDVYEQIKDVSAVKIQGLFEKIIKFFSELLDKTILLLIDEYEYLFKYSFDSPTGFMRMRTLSTQSLERGLRPFSFWIAGAVSWDYLCTLTGSGELNVITTTETITPLTKEDFSLMWQSELEPIEDTLLKTKIAENLEFAYMKSGGVPFYGKHIGNYIIKENKQPDFSILKSYFNEVDTSLILEEKKILNNLAKLPKNIKDSKQIINLLNRGIIYQNNNKSYEVSIGFYKDYLIATTKDEEQMQSILLESHKLTKTITDLIETINNTLSNKRKPLMFELVNDSSSLENDLRTECHTKEQFADFASSLYKTYFERTKQNNKKGERLPKGDHGKSKYVYSEFAKCVDTFRHTFGGGHLTQNFTTTNGQISKADALEILVGSKNEPHTAEDFSKLQIALLKKFECELNKILGEVRKTR